MSEIKVETNSKSYPIYLKNNFKDLKSSLLNIPNVSKFVIITERSIAGIYFKYLSSILAEVQIPIVQIFIKGKEKNKHIKQTRQVYNELILNKIDRNAVILALGGGIVGDFAGFISATYLRGIRFIQLPTTLLAQVDSSVGGKVAVNADFGKNMIGSFYHPEFVYSPLFSLKTLPDKEWKCGLAEIIKHAILAGGEFYEKVKDTNFKKLKKDKDLIKYFIQQSILLKSKIVSEDEKETGKRKLLNLGHTTAHAIESLTKYKKHTHGEAVAIGLVTMTMLSIKKFNLDDKLLTEIIGILKNYKLPIKDKSKPSDIYEHMIVDKKNVNNEIRFTLIKKIGEPVFDISLDKKNVLESLKLQKKIN